jgi:hypothetical protein
MPTASPAAFRAAHVERCIAAAREQHAAIYEEILKGLPPGIRKTVEREVAIVEQSDDPDGPLRAWLDEIQPGWRQPQPTEDEWWDSIR